MVDLLVYTNHRMGDIMYYNTNGLVGLSTWTQFFSRALPLVFVFCIILAMNPKYKIVPKILKDLLVSAKVGAHARQVDSQTR